MNTQHTAPTAVATASNAVYDIRINERQRHYLMLGLQALAAQVFVPGDHEKDEYGNDIIVTLEDMLNPNGTTGPLYPIPGINSFVV